MADQIDYERVQVAHCGSIQEIAAKYADIIAEHVKGCVQCKAKAIERQIESSIELLIAGHVAEYGMCRSIPNPKRRRR